MKACARGGAGALSSASLPPLLPSGPTILRTYRPGRTAPAEAVRDRAIVGLSVRGMEGDKGGGAEPEEEGRVTRVKKRAPRVGPSARRSPSRSLSPHTKRKTNDMTIKYVLLVNKQGQTRLARYAVPLPPLAERVALEGEVVRKCLARSDKLVREKRERKERARVRAGGGGRRHARAHVRTPWPPRARVPDTLGLPPSRGDGVPKAGQGSRGTGVHACRSVTIFCCLPRAQPLSPLVSLLSPPSVPPVLLHRAPGPQDRVPPVCLPVLPGGRGRGRGEE